MARPWTPPSSTRPRACPGRSPTRRPRALFSTRATIKTLSVTFTPTDTTDYTSATDTVPINVWQATPTITWANPASIVYGTALSATQLDAASLLDGGGGYLGT